MITHTAQNKLMDKFIRLWDSINTTSGQRWDDNPTVWVYVFEKVEQTMKHNSVVRTN